MFDSRKVWRNLPTFISAMGEVNKADAYPGYSR